MRASDLAAPAASGGGCGWFDVLAHGVVMIRRHDYL
jgi:hypothetical protein